MPEKIVLEDGTEREVPTEEELKSYQEAQTKLEEFKPIAEQFDTLKTELEVKEGESLTDKLKELKESANPNWQKARAVIKSLKEVAKEKGVEVDDDGNVIKKAEGLTPEEAQRIANETFEQKTSAAKKAATLSKFSKEDADSISAIYDKLSAVGGTFEENMELAISKVLPDQAKSAFTSAINAPGGGAPKVKTDGKADISPDVKGFAMDKFGLTEEDFNNVNK